MNIILKHTFKSMRQNRAQIAMIVATVMVVVGMFFASLSMFDIFFNINAAEFARLAADADMIVGEHYNGKFYSPGELESFLAPFADNITYKKSFIKMSGVLKTDSENIGVLVEATDLEKYLENAPLYGKYTKEELPYPKIVVSQRFAGENNLQPGDMVEVFLGTINDYKKFNIYAISDNVGIFASGAAINVLIDLKDAESYAGLVNVTLLKFKDKQIYTQVETVLAEQMSSISVGEALNTTYNRQVATNNTLLFAIALLFIVGMMVLILVTSYIIIVKSRLSEMIIFKTAGATPVQTTLIMLLEALIYAVVGAFLGLVVGRGGMALAEHALLANFTSTITYEWWKWVLAFTVGIAVTLLSVLIPILKLSKQSIREASAGSVKEVKIAKPLFLIIILACVAVVIVAMRSLPTFYVFAFSGLLIVLIAVFIITSSSRVHLWVSKLAAKVFHKGIFRLSAATTKRNAAAHNVSILVATVTAFSFMVVAIIDFVNVMLTLSQSRYTSDYVVEYRYEIPPERKELLGLEGELREHTGVESAYLLASVGLEWKDAEGKYANADKWINLVGLANLSYLQSIIADSNKIEYLLEEYIANPQSVENPAVCNVDIIKRFNLKVGDKLCFTIEEKDGSKRDYQHFVTIVGIDYTTTEYDKYIYTDLELLYDEQDSLQFSTRYLINAEQSAYLSLREYLEGNEELGNRAFIFKYQRWLYASALGLGGVQSLLTLLQFVIVLIAFLGVVNISIVTFYDRRAEFNIYKFSGMSIRDYLLHALGESVIIGLSGILIGATICASLYQMMPALAIIAGKYMIFSAINVKLGVVLAACFMLFCSLWYAIARASRRQFNSMKSQNQRLI